MLAYYVHIHMIGAFVATALASAIASANAQENIIDNVSVCTMNIA